jgi:CubicO group peptidase (beta-lactamase class C family)
MYKLTQWLWIAGITISFSTYGQKQKKESVYYPEPNVWVTKTPESVGMNAAKIQEAIAYARERESKNPRNLEESHYQSFGKEPFGDAVGPFAERGDPTGIIIRNGYIVAEWGDPQRVDMTFSVTKSLVSSVVGIAYDRKLIASISDTVYRAIGPIQVYDPNASGNKADRYKQPQLVNLFNTPHNRTITWNDFLRQTSDWEGTLWGKPDWADRPGDKPSEWLTRPRNKPGAVYEYNDVRVNVLALCALNIWRKPLPEVLRDEVMNPIGASATWRWFGYENSWIVLDGKPVQAVGGGGHWGGGMFINARDMARFGYLTLRRGKWRDKQILSDQWVTWALTPTPAQPTYGFMNWFLNTDKKMWPSAPATAFTHIGNGANMIYVDPEHDIVAVVRWIESNAMDEFLKRLLAAIEK